VQHHNSLKVLSLLIKQLGIPVTHASIIAEFQKHPDPQSLLAFSDLFDRWNVPNAAYQVSLEELLETELPLPFIACFKKSEFVLVTKKTASQIVVSNDRWNNHVLSLDEFNNKYQGTILAVEKEESSGESDYAVKRKKEIVEYFRVPLVLSGVLLLIAIYFLLNHRYFAGFNWRIGLLIILKTLGIITSVFLLMQSLNANNPLIQKICGSDENKNCNAILSSKAAKLFTWLSWSEVGFFYFSGTFLVLFFNNSDDNIMRWLAILNILCLPYTFYSIYYQWRIAKQWCVFCCSVQALLWLEFFALFPYLLEGHFSPDLYCLGRLFMGILAPILFWIYVKPHLTNSSHLGVLKPELYKYKYNKQLFQNMLHQELKYKLPSEDNTIVIGNKAANNIVTLVSNPFCPHCSKMHHILDDLVDMRDDIKLQLVFVSRRYRKEIDQRVIGHFMALKSDNNENKLKQAINDWYKQEKKIYEAWSETYPAMELKITSEPLNEQQVWANRADITSTPTLFINGRKLPSVYQGEDIKYVL